MFSLALVSSGVNGVGMDWSSAFSTLTLFVVVGYIFGIGPAFIAGVIYASLLAALQRLVLAPLSSRSHSIRASARSAKAACCGGQAPLPRSDAR